VEVFSAAANHKPFENNGLCPGSQWKRT